MNIMSIVLVGSVGVGMVWGWLAGHMIFQRGNAIVKATILAVGTMVALMQIYLLSDMLSIPYFAFAVICTFIIHMGWVYKLRQIRKYYLIREGGIR
jgi:hypothetical protein